MMRSTCALEGLARLLIFLLISRMCFSFLTYIGVGFPGDEIVKFIEKVIFRQKKGSLFPHVCPITRRNNEGCPIYTFGE